MQKIPVTPQKKLNAYIHTTNQPSLKELSPFFLTVAGSSANKHTPIIEFQSPVPERKDLFLQLLGSQQKYNNENYWWPDEILQQDSQDYIQDISIDVENNENNQEEIDSQQDDSDEQNQVRKRKRKTSNQIKMLKAELQLIPNWNKQKIIQMSQITGLSQSQVYKWWWDQKKKNNKQGQDYKYMKHKIIKKQSRHIDDERQQSYLTKPKIYTTLVENETDKKINKKLYFTK